jgi:hypothetical protein
MSWGYWGIVAGLMTLIATLFACIELSYSKTKGSPKASSSRIAEPSEAVTPASAGHRRAA